MARVYNPQLAEMGEKIVSRREELGMTATELAIYVGITSAALSRIENGQSEAKVTTLMKIADILTVPLSYFQPSDSAVSTNNIPPELLALVPKLKNKTHSEQRKLMQMIATMIDAICPSPVFGVGHFYCNMRCNEYQNLYYTTKNFKRIIVDYKILRKSYSLL